MSNIFRKVALDRLSSPEELDRLMNVTSARGWIALLGIIILLVVAVLWGVLGSIPSKLTGQCILVVRGGLNTVSTLASGRVSDLSVVVGDHVTRGQIIGRIEQPDLLHRVQNAGTQLNEAQRQHQQNLMYAKKSFDLTNDDLTRQQNALNHQIQAIQEKIRLLQERQKTQQQLLDQGLITRQTLINTELELRSVQLEQNNIRNQLENIDMLRLETKKRMDTEVDVTRNQLEEAEYLNRSVLDSAKEAINITSAYTGRVVELQVNEGQLVHSGLPIISVESTGIENNELEAYIYLPISEGKKIKTGMVAEISPTTVKREEFGFLPAHVQHVSDYPSSNEGLMRIFGNSRVVAQMSEGMAPLQVTAALTPSLKTVSRYEWSTREGPSLTLQSGTLCHASITVQEQRPITLVIPLLKKTLGLS